MEKIAREKLTVKIVCVALAAILWFYVSYQENPSMSKTVRNVPLAITGEQALKENGFSVYSVSEKSVDVRVTAKRLSLARLTNRTTSAVINVSSIKESGEYTIPATASSSITSNATYYVKGKDITVVIEPIRSKKFNVEVDIATANDPSLILNSYELSHEQVTVSAPESVMKEISAVRTETITPDKDDNDQTTKLAVYGKNGKLLEGAECSPAEIDVTYSFYDVKTVPVVLKTTAEKTYSLSEDNTVKIYGSGASFENIKQIETVEVNLAQYEPGSKARFALNLPKGVKLADGSNEIEVTLDKSFYEELESTKKD